ncbi:general secretion pathway protein B [Idiomarina aquatica]|uniref:General secretion pathway protein B n=1 Tax=Idiomarina aquatica TaxID=1327752 RepID=A0A4R6PAN0_9GAMM|nr:general secretion pathway protein GspB [Idiomarina aquatica]TDP33259.1 general secretion pathway protein B [Idiomarina aquatica]
MSSLLKALKQQQSPLVSQRSDIDPALLSSETNKPWGRVLLWTVIIVIILLLIATSVMQWRSSTLAQNNIATTEATAERYSDYQLGSTLAVEAIKWEASTQPASTEARVINEADSSESQAIARQPSQREPLDLNQVSPELLAKFEQAIADSDYENTNSDAQSSSLVPPLNELEQTFKRQVPQFSYDGHMYVSDAQQRWVELNKQRFYVGEQFGGVRIERIEPQQLVLSVDGKAFSVEALQDWSGQ